MLIAHRGLVKDNIKENTIEAFKAAINSAKYAGFELDVRETKDHKFVVYHNLTYKGKLVKKTLYKEMEKDNIPRLIDVLKLDTNKIIMIEIKDFNLDRKNLAKLLNKYNYKNLYISSFGNKVLKELKKYIKNIKTGNLNYVLNSKEEYGDYDFICLLNVFLTKDLIDYFQKKNIEIFSYGISEKSKIVHPKIYYIVDDKIM